MAKIVTFYSYKGGTGRSMALANVAWILASNGHRVLTIDWDLEAPGLHHYFRPFLLDPDLRGYGVRGVIDLVFEYASEVVTPDRAGTDSKSRPSDWYKPYADITQCAIPLRWPSGEILRFGSQGGIDFVPAGRQAPETYAARVNGLDWRRFYEKQSGGAFIDAVKDSMSGYDYVLIDSRTGVSDTAGVCTVQLPASVVLCFTLNNQSIKGVANIAAAIAAQAPDKLLFPVPMRVDPFEKEKLNRRREYAHGVFADQAQKLKESLGVPAERYWQRVEIPYYASYAYEETLAPFEKFAGSVGSILPALEFLTGAISEKRVEALGERPSDEVRDQIVAAYEATDTTPVTSAVRQSLRTVLARLGLAATVLAAVVAGIVYFLASARQTRPSEVIDRLVAAAQSFEPKSTWHAASIVGSIAAGTPPPGVMDVALRLAARPVPYAVLPGRYSATAIAPAGQLAAGIWTNARLEVIDITSLEARAGWSDVPVGSGDTLQFSVGSDRLTILSNQATSYDVESAALRWSRLYPHPRGTDGGAVMEGFNSDQQLWTVLHQTGRDQVAVVYNVRGRSALPVSEFPDVSKDQAPFRPGRKQLSADGQRLLIEQNGGRSLWTLPDEGLLWGSNTLLSGRVIADNLLVRAITLDPRGSFGATFSLWDLTEPARVWAAELPELPSDVALSTAARFAALVFSDGRIEIMEMTTPFSSVRSLPSSREKGGVVAAQFDEKGQLLLVRYKDSTAAVFRVAGVPPLSEKPSWPDLRDYLREASGGCPPPDARQTLYDESPDVARTAFAACRTGRSEQAQRVQSAK